MRDPARLVQRMAWGSLRPLLAGSDPDRDVVLARLRAFALELLRWNQGVSNLISHDDEPRLLDRHIVESLVGVNIINDLGCNKLVDFGSGGGFPALPLTLAGAGRHWKLVESRRNKTLFLRRVVQELAIAEVDVVTGRLEVLVKEDPASLSCDGFTSRATMKLGPTLELAAEIVEPGGHAILWKGSGFQDELAGSREQWEAKWATPVIHPIADGPNTVSVFLRKPKD
jgi:16S rRNA (guanine527-N7)-methyltransferase